MARSAPKPLKLPDQARKRATEILRGYVQEELDVEMGDLKATLLLDFFVAEIGPTIYNQAINDGRVFFEERIGDLAAVAVREEFPSAKR